MNNEAEENQRFRSEIASLIFAKKVQPAISGAASELLAMCDLVVRANANNAFERIKFPIDDADVAHARV